MMISPWTCAFLISATHDATQSGNNSGWLWVRMQIERSMESGLLITFPSESLKLLPEYTSPVDNLDVLRNPLLTTEVVDSTSARLQIQIVVDNNVSSDRELRVKGMKRHDSGFIHVTVEPEYCEPLNRRVGQGIPEPTGQKTNPVVEKVVARKVRAHLFKGSHDRSERPVAIS